MPDIPSEPDQKEPRESHVDWPSDTLPLVYVAFRGPAYSDYKKDKAALDLLAPIAFGENSDLYQKLVLKEQKLDSLSYIFEDRADPELFLVAAKLKDVKDTDYVRQQILETYQHFAKEPVPKDKLDSTRSRLRYQFALGMDSSEAIAGALAGYIGLRRTPLTIDKLFALYDTITPEDMREMAAKYFVDNHRTIVTLSTRRRWRNDDATINRLFVIVAVIDDWESCLGPFNSKAATSRRTPNMNSADTNTVLLPNRSPLVSFRILFMTGSAYDPKGKEGLASLTAAMLAEGGSRTKTYSEITDAMYPMATSFQWQVDKEMTVFSGSTHIDNLDKYYALIREMLLDPGFREDDFKRLKEDAINYLKTSLRGGNDEELGKEVLYTMIYPSTHPYGHQNRGAIGALEKMTIKDVRDFYQNNFTQANLVMGLAGGYPEKFPAQVQSDFAKLPKGSPNGMKLSRPAQTPGNQDPKSSSAKLARRPSRSAFPSA